MNQFLKNQKYIFISIFGSFIIIGLAWYFLLHKGLSGEYKKSEVIKSKLTRETKKIREMESQIAAMQTEWDTLSSEFEMIIGKIPDKRIFENVTDHLYSLILKHGLKIEKYSPSNRMCRYLKRSQHEKQRIQVLRYFYCAN